MSPKINDITGDWITDPLTGFMTVVDGNKETVQSQQAELKVNNNEWYLNTSYGYPYFLEGPDKMPAGILGTKMDPEFLTNVISDKLLSYPRVRTINSIRVEQEGNILTAEVIETLEDAESIEEISFVGGTLLNKIEDGGV